VTVEPASDELATRQGLPQAAHERRVAAGQTPQMSQQIAIATMREEEHDTTRMMIRVGRALGAAVLLALLFVPGSEALRIALAITVAFALGCGVWVERYVAKQGHLREHMMVFFAYTASPSIFIASLFFGIYSAAQLFPALALYFFSRRERFGSALALYLTNAIAQALAAALVITGAVDDPGIVVLVLPPHILLVGHLLIQIGFLAAFLLGRGSHRATREAIGRMHKAMLAAAQKDALLHEARADLDRALAIDAPGRFTDHTFGEYRLGNVIGRGGMGEVYEAFHVDTGDAAAVKLLAVRELGNPQSVERFLREVRAVRGLSSQHVVSVLAASSATDDIPYLVMERLRGNDLAHHLRSGKLTLAALDEMLEQVGAAVEEAWSKGIVHRDLKPQNLFLVEDRGRPHWKVLDFGVAALEDHSGTLTQGKVVGTPAYMAPEQARGERVDHRADVYAIAAIAYRWLTGRPVVSGRDLHNALYQTVHVMPQAPSSLAAELHEDLDRVLAIGLVKDPALRFDSVKELRAALAAAANGLLDPKLRVRAAKLVEKHPWGAVRGSAAS
jgi:serine/threonine-protein kinase